MAHTSIPVDLFNPAQVFACLGLLEAADVLLGSAHGGFDWGPGGSCDFHLSAPRNTHPIAAVLSFVAAAEVWWLSPHAGLRERDGGATETRSGIADSGQPKAADLPAILRGRHGNAIREIPFGYWADGSSRFSTTFKKSTNGASSHIRFNNALSGLRDLAPQDLVADPFNQSARTESLFRLDPRGSVDPIHSGFSPDALRKGTNGGFDIRVATYPACELFAILGLQHARPERLGPGRFAYHAWRHEALLSPSLSRVAVGRALGFGEVRRFVVEHIEVKKGGDRKMTRIDEEVGGD